MKSKWFHLKSRAITLRKQGLSIKQIESRLGIPRSTLSGWLREIKISNKHREKLLANWRGALVKARARAALWHNNQKALRLSHAKNQARETLREISTENKSVLDLSLAMLYLGEGFKKTLGTGMGNSNPLILRFFINVLKGNYNLDESRFKCELHLRADQDPQKLKVFWSQQLKIPMSNFTSVSIDKRTLGKPTYSNYPGVCVVRCGNVAIQRKLVYLSELYCKTVAEQLGS